MGNTHAADSMIHIFRTFMGIPPDINDRPICGATLTKAYDFAPRPRPYCDRCAAERARLIAEAS